MGKEREHRAVIATIEMWGIAEVMSRFLMEK